MMERTSYEFVVSDTFKFEGLINDQNFKAIAIPYEVTFTAWYPILITKILKIGTRVIYAILCYGNIPM